MPENDTNAVAFIPRNRLSKVLDAPDGATFRVLVAKAETNVDLVRAMVADTLATDIAELVAMCARTEEEIFADIRRIERMALKITENATVAERPELSMVARGISELVDIHLTRGVWNAAAVKLHVDAMRLIRAGASLTADDLAMLATYLDKMRASLAERGSTGDGPAQH